MLCCRAYYVSNVLLISSPLPYLCNSLSGSRHQLVHSAFRLLYPIVNAIFSSPMGVSPTLLHSSLTRIFHFLAFIPNASIQSSFSRPLRIKTAFFPHLVLLSLVRVFYPLDQVPNVGVSPFSCCICQNTTLSCRKITTRQKIHFSWQ